MMKLGLSINRGGTILSEANKYIAAVTNAAKLTNPSFSVSDYQKTLIKDFISIEKSSGRWSKIKRFYLPIWGSSAANAIDLKTGKSILSWHTNSVHSDGWASCDVSYVNGWSSGDTVYSLGLLKNVGVTPGSMASTGQNPGMFILIADTDDTTYVDGDEIALIYTGLDPTQTNSYWGLYQEITDISNTRIRMLAGNLSTTMSQAATSFANTRGIISLRFNYLDQAICQRTSSARNTLATTCGSGGISTSTSVTFKGMSNCPRKIGAFGINLSMTDAEDSAYTLNIKNLWEGLTGLAIS